MKGEGGGGGMSGGRPAPEPLRSMGKGEVEALVAAAAAIKERAEGGEGRIPGAAATPVRAVSSGGLPVSLWPGTKAGEESPAECAATGREDTPFKEESASIEEVKRGAAAVEVGGGGRTLAPFGSGGKRVEDREGGQAATAGPLKGEHSKEEGPAGTAEGEGGEVGGEGRSGAVADDSASKAEASAGGKCGVKAAGAAGATDPAEGVGKSGAEKEVARREEGRCGESATEPGQARKGVCEGASVSG